VFPATAALLVVGFYIIARANYLLYHALIELFSVVVAGLIFTVSWITRDQEYSLFPSVIGVGYAFVGLLDIIHTIAYKGMGIFAETGANLATQLWIAGRFLETFVLLTAPFVRNSKTRRALSVGYVFYGVVVLLAIFWWKIFPTCYIEGTGLTPFKITSEYIIMGILMGALYAVRRGRTLLPPVMVRYLSYSILATIASEFFFTLYVNVYDLANFTGHLLKLVSYSFLLYGIVVKCIREPLSGLYQSLYQDNLRLGLLAVTDPLTGLHNRGAAMVLMKTKLEQSQKLKVPLSFVMIDVDHFKAVNDSYGHQAGDIVLQELAGLITKVVRSALDVAGRFGGEEFIVALWNADASLALNVAERIRWEVENHLFVTQSGQTLRITLSLGVAQAKDGEELDEIIARADRALYQAKLNGRNRTALAK